MFAEQGVFELVFLAAVALIVVGPKDLPVLMRKVGKFTAKMRGLAAEFRASFDEMARQSELDELRKEVEALRQGVQAPNLHQMLGTAPVKHDLEQQFDELQHGLTPPPVVAVAEVQVVGADSPHSVDSLHVPQSADSPHLVDSPRLMNPGAAAAGLERGPSHAAPPVLADSPHSADSVDSPSGAAHAPQRAVAADIGARA